MNNEINFEEFIKNIDCTIYEKIDVDNWNISIKVVLDVVEFLQRSLEDMRTCIVNHPFSNKEEEIYFFKHIKPETWKKVGKFIFSNAPTLRRISNIRVKSLQGIRQQNYRYCGLYFQPHGSGKH